MLSSFAHYSKDNWTPSPRTLQGQNEVSSPGSRTAPERKMDEKNCGKIGASEGIRTLDIHLGKVTLYQAELRSRLQNVGKLRESPTKASPVLPVDTRQPSHLFSGPDSWRQTRTRLFPPGKE